ncbi:trigger factor [Candidatus Saccharibacteria bacterium]|nr:trigger factor [Candidatus Saccharibacteria bacterium]
MIKSTNKKSGSTMTLTISVDAQFIEPYKISTLKKLKKDLKVDGFRPGHAPDNIVVRELGEARVQAEVLEEVIDHAFNNQMREHKIESLGSPSIELVKFVPYTELEFKAEFPIAPAIDFDYSKLKIKKALITIEPSKIDEAIEVLRSQMASRVSSKQPIQQGDEVRFDFDGKRAGQPVEGASAKNHTLIVGEGTFIPGFEENLIGLKATEEKTFEVTFPKDYQAQDLKGAKVDFSVKVNEVFTVNKPKIDDEFAKTVGNKANIKELRDDIKKVLTEQEEAQKSKAYENKILDELLKKAKFEVPEQLVSQQTAKLEEEMEKNLHNSGMDKQKYLGLQKLSEGDLKQEITTEADKRVRAALILKDVIEKYQLVVSALELDQELAKMAEQYKSDPKIQAELTHDHFRADLTNHLLTQKAIAKLTQFASA